jgi:hypothetical protein
LKYIGVFLYHPKPLKQNKMKIIAPKGYYRTLLKDFPEVRIAYTHTPIIGCKIIPSEPFIQHLEKSKDMYAKFYAEGLKNGTMVTITELQCNRVYANNGELYFTT